MVIKQNKPGCSIAYQDADSYLYDKDEEKTLKWVAAVLKDRLFIYFSRSRPND
jgi:hypothetical protein